MAKARIQFEIDQDSLANAQKYVAQHRGSLDSFVTTFFSTLVAKDGAAAAFTGCLLESVDDNEAPKRTIAPAVSK